MEALDALPPAQIEQFLDGPALKPPPGVVSNFSDAPNRTALCVGITITCIVLVTLGAIIRLYTRIFCMKKMRLEDYLMIAALGLYAGFLYIEMSLYVFPGGFVHQWDIRVKDSPPLLKGINIGSIIYGFVVVLLKVSIFLDWIQIFTASSGIRGPFYYCCIANIVANIVFYIPCIFIDIFACMPRHRIWSILEHGKCLNMAPTFLASSIFNFVLDLVMLTMPINAIWRLQLPLRKKVGMSSLFVVGIFGCVCGALRIPFALDLLRSADKFYAITGCALAGTGEMAAGFLIFCIPSIPKLLKSSPKLNKFLSKLLSWIGFSFDDSKPNSRLGLPSWIRAQGRHETTRRRPADTVCSEFDGYSAMPSANDKQLDPSTSKREDSARSEHQNELP